VQIENLTLDRIKLDDLTFDLGFVRNYETLRCAIAEVGILQPLIVRRRTAEERCRIVCGFGRARVASDLNLPRLAVLSLPSETTDADCVRLALFDNLAHRQLNPIERAITLDKLGRHISRDALIRDYMPLLRMQPSAEWLERTLTLLGLDERLKRAVAGGRIEEKVGALLAGLAAGDQEAFACLLERCRPSVSVVREWAESLVDVARRDKRSLVAILASDEAAAILDSGDESEAERTAAMRRLIRRMRYPSVSAFEDRFAEARAALRMPPSMRLEPPANFESDEMRLEIRFQDPEQLRGAVSLMENWFDDPTLLKKLWKSTLNAEC
jgi:hypothetical protein